MYSKGWLRTAVAARGRSLTRARSSSAQESATEWVPRSLLLSVGAIVLVCLGGCAELRGIPQGLSPDDAAKLSQGDLVTALSTGDNLRKTYADARDSNLDWKFWSTIPYIPLAGGAAGAIYYKASEGVLAGFGLAAGTLTGLNTFINAKGNAATYQKGVAALQCVRATLSVFTTSSRKQAVTQTLKTDLTQLTKAIGQSESDLSGASKVDFSSPAAKAEVMANPGVVSTFATAQKALSDSISAANTAANSATTEIDAFNDMGSFAGRTILGIDQLVSAQITSGTVDFATLQSAISSSISNEVSAKKTAGTSSQPPSKIPAPVRSLLVPAGSSTPIGTAISNMTVSTVALTSDTKTVTADVAITGVVNAEAAATACTPKF